MPAKLLSQSAATIKLSSFNKSPLLASGLARIVCPIYCRPHDIKSLFSKVGKQHVDSLSALQSKSYSSLATSLQNVRTVKLKHDIFEPPTNIPLSSHRSPLVFLHGLFGSKRNWESIAKALCRKLQRKIITVDARNHGDSHHDDEMNYVAMAADTVALLQNDLGLTRVILVGHSMGGKTAMTLTLLQPSLIEGLVVEDIAPEMSQTGLRTDFTGYLAAMKAVSFDQKLSSLSLVRRAVGEQIKHVFHDKPLRDFILTNLDQRDGQYCWRINLHAIEAHLQDIVGIPSFNSSAQYLGPTLFIGGQNSPNISSQSQAEIKRLFPLATIHHVPGAGHWVHSEKPAEFIDQVHNFVISSAR